MSERIIFVCSGNICRSPLAAGMAREKLAQRDHQSVIISAGTLQIVGKPAAGNSVKAADEIGIDISSHRSQGLTRPLMERADHLVVMAPNHEEFIVKHAPGASGKIVRLWEFTDGYSEIADPIGRSLDAFRHCREVLDEALDGWIDELCE